LIYLTDNFYVRFRLIKVCIQIKNNTIKIQVMIFKKIQNYFIEPYEESSFTIRQKANIFFVICAITFFLLTAVSVINLTTSVSTHPVLISVVNIFIMMSLSLGFIFLRKGNYNYAVNITTSVIAFGVSAGSILKFNVLVDNGFNNYTYFMFAAIAFAALFGTKRLQIIITAFFIILNSAFITTAFLFYSPKNPNYLMGTTINILIALFIVLYLSYLTAKVTEASFVKTESELERNISLKVSLEQKLGELGRANEELEQMNEELEAMYEEQQVMNEELQTTSGELEDSNEKLLIFKRFAESSANCLLMSTIGGDVIYSNRSFNTLMCGDVNSDTSGSQVRAFYDSMIWESIEQKIMPEVMDKGQWIGELPVRGYNGKQIEAIQNIFLLNDSSNVPSFIAIIITDISYQKHVEREIFKSESRLKNILLTANEGFLELDNDGFLIDANKELSKILGCDFNQIIGRNITEFIDEDNYKVYKEHQDLRKEGKASAYELLFQRSDQQAVPCLVKGTPLFNQAGQKTGAFGLITDLTEQKQLEMQLLLSQKMEAVGTLAGGIAHDFNNLLTAISGYSQLMISQMDEKDEHLAHVQEIVHAAERSSDLTRQLLAFSRRQMLKRRVFSIKYVIQGMETMLNRIIGENYILTITCVEDCVVDADYGQIEQVLMNLVVNARDAMPKGGKIFVDVDTIHIDEKTSKIIASDEKGDTVRIIINDTGSGMEKEVIQKIFDPFFTTKEVGEGTGLGLAVVYGIIKQHDGWIKVTSRPEDGTSFIIGLPRVREVEADEIISTGNVETTGGEGETVLLVEDQDEVRKFSITALEKYGYRVMAAANLAEARKLFETEGNIFDVVFSDVVLPDGNGPELVDELLVQKPDLKVLLSSGYTDKKAQWDRIMERGYKFLPKPYSLESLLDALKEVLNRNREEDLKKV